MSEFNFKSQICTSREQSKRLLALGLKKETSDMMHYAYLYPVGGDIFKGEYHIRTKKDNVWDEIGNEHRIPAWSLGRLLELSYGDAHPNNVVSISAHNPFEYMIKTIEGFIKHQCFNKEYLV